ncbi:PrsW family intramembrane metalloprotease [Leptothermofonsia sichuanensis E412]|uniref:PrsW family glutamic-type intramembrane protease n=1 Tax=Leptothermofonsia sichuanensis TaxID=2917832 RepID=UPI001CA77D83|nr:PrsW family glutamic-type intramembrane protease [Leptothermofonsia sichuanensis]QZZ20659.1 PrsW family intramembrane metalloprotease [Leptothermofonsia sichuanensis E412]
MSNHPWKFRFKDVVPYEEVFKPELYNHGNVRFLLFFGLFPLLVSLLGFGDDLRNTAWLLGIYYACIWGLVLRNFINPGHFTWGKTLTCVFFVLVLGIPLLLLLQLVPPFSFLYQGIRRGVILDLIGFVLGVGVLEESIKALPVYLFLVNPGKVQDPQSTAFYGAVSGLGFAISEGVTYSLQYATGLSEGFSHSLRGMDQQPLEGNISGFLLVITIRFVCLPLFHAIWAGISGYFLGLSTFSRSQQWTIILVGLAIAAVLHGLYNFFSNNILGLLIMAFSILLFLTYLRNSQKMIRGARET